MASRKEVVEVIGNLIKNGINMDNYNIFECNMFMKELSEFINAETHLSCEYAGKKITIESVFFTPLVSVELEKTTIQCIPITDEGWIDAVFEVIKFMHLKELERKEIEQQKRKKKIEDDKEFDWI